MKRMSFAVFSVVYFLACAPPSILAQNNYTAATCNLSDVDAVINGPTHKAVDGDTINIPSGSCSWTTGITVPSNIGITIAGNGTPDSGSGTSVPSSSCASGTTITLSPTTTTTAFSFTPEYGNSTTRLSCMTLAYGSGPSVAFKFLGTCTSSGCPNLRMDNITFSNWTSHSNAGISYGIGAVGDMFGVIDHNNVPVGGGQALIEQSNASYLGVGSYGDNSWAQPENYGSANFLFLENNTFDNAATMDNEGSAGSLANQGGGRVVVRYNTFTDLSSTTVPLAWHGTESNGRPRSSRAWEFYENTMTCGSGVQCLEAVGPRGGTGLTWGNTMNTTGGINSFLTLNTFRTQGNPGSTSWQGACDGSSAYDTNDGVTYYSGTISSYTTSYPNYIITVSGSPGWTTNQWFQNGAPYSVHDVTQSNGTEITANGSNTITTPIDGGPGGYVPAAGDSFEILRATVCIDQAGGRGVGILYSGSPASPTSSANEVASTTYEWMDTLGANPSFGVINSDTARVIANRDFYKESVNQSAQTSTTSPFNGSSGNGHGTSALRPTSCTTGVGYWATDQSELYQCTTTNTWSAFYKPYTYPHPLTTGDPPPAPPTSLQAVVQ